MLHKVLSGFNTYETVRPPAGAFEILVWGLSAKGAVGSVVVLEVGEGIDALIEGIEPMRQVVAGTES